ncbi:DNA-binding LacI/PurR family transcriptional regulator [Motilibacter peucedani]|uniref:DNA-binding LacI/PurR family transcriptional regulator n=1 Tax=Motilibacter peucedani TaxID=598650 RepID=A0A420XTP8_9ACTN|nr:LacI family DNA-binding transcriptional regulator [Motilibacter peucedani]RKS80208.1 DNA-binding LacI/PurR family transcriptional regulator [Motilibacter peucedani]
MSAGARTPTLGDVAALAGVTVPTVSKVLNARSDVSPATRERVLAALQRTGYAKPPRGRRGTTAAAGARTQPGLVDLVLGSVEGSWGNRVLGGVERAAAELGHDVVVTLADPDTADGRSWVDRLLARGSTGAVLALVDASAQQRARLADGGVPVVLLDPRSEPGPGVASVGATNWAGGRAAGEHLVALGHRDIGVVAGPPQQVYSTARVDGLRSALTEAGLVLAPERVRSGDWTSEGGQRAAAELLGSRPAPTAVFACSDRMALGVYAEAAARGLRIPEDLAVVGFDDLPEARWLVPTLTTVRQPVREMGAVALRTLLRLRAGGAPETTRLELATSLVVRASAPAVPRPEVK